MTRIIAGASVLLLLFLSSPSFLVSADTRHHRRDDVTGHIPSTHEEIVSRRQEHSDLFTSRLDEVNIQLDSHTSGERLLTETQYYKLERKKKAYEGKLEELNREFDERHSRRILQREEILNDRTKTRIERATNGEL
ncbi:MAG: hypothetical protein ACI8RD_005525 [Bacillariaceae sp.]|jgi:hypothetical protein